MRIARTCAELDAVLDGYDSPLAFVPTMGSLHAGHLKLVECARSRAPRTAVSIFVNPLQFGAGEDFESYPRSFDTDRAVLEAAGVDILFAPGMDDMYPDGADAAPRVEVPSPLADTLEGASRPGHFDGVATVVARLFELVRPDIAVFGEKDYQQLLVIRWLVRELGLPVEVAAVPTVREPDGLALSSRNRYLGDDERARAPAMYCALAACAEALRIGTDDVEALESRGRSTLEAAGFEPDYFAVRDADTLAAPRPGSALVALAAARLGRARLIDNLHA